MSCSRWVITPSWLSGSWRSFFYSSSVCSCHLCKSFPQFVVVHTVKVFTIVRKVVDVFLELSCFFNDPVDVGNLISGSSAFSKTSLNIWKLIVHISHLESDILECELKWALGSISTNKTSGGDGIPVELFQILKGDTVKHWTQYTSKFGKFSSGPRTGKGQFSFQSQRKAMPKNAQTTAQLHSSHTLAK